MVDDSSHNKDDDSKALGKSTIFTSRSLLITLIGALLGGLAFGFIGYFAEKGSIAIPRLEPLFAAPYSSVTIFLIIFGASLGAMLFSLASADRVHPADTTKGKGDREKKHKEQNLNKWLSWGIAVLSAAIILSAVGYIWVLSTAYGNGAYQDTRIGYTLKNVQRVSGDTPGQVGNYMTRMYQSPLLEAPADPLAAAVMAPVASARNQTLVYGAGGDQADMDALVGESLSLLTDSPVIVIVSANEPAYALPAAYTAAYFGAPVVPVEEGSIPPDLQDMIENGGENAGNEKLILVAAPERLLSDSSLEKLEAYGEVNRVADENIYKHALLWARSRWGNFGWGMDETHHFDAYYNFVLANPETPEFAAAGIPMAYQGNYGPLLYTGDEDLNDHVDQYFWRLSPDFFDFPSDGPFMNVRVVGDPESVSYNAQARADLGLEMRSFKNQAAGASGLALLGWSWFFIGLFGAIWALFIMPRRLPYSSHYPRLYWPMAILVLGPVGVLAFLMSYHERPMIPGKMTKFTRPPWARALSATIMSIGIGMALMIASMYLFQFFGLPLLRTFEFTSVYWLGSPMTTIMWLVMVIPAIILSALFYMGPMMADMKEMKYLAGVRKAFPVVIISMVTASIGMFTTAWYVMMWRDWMSSEDLWLWVTPLWISAAAGFFVALVPNYFMVKAGWKEGEM
jgi:MFS family permease